MRFTKGKKFKIMQITDIQEIPAVSPDTTALLEAAVEAENPDLVVYLSLIHISEPTRR